jgi:hypothetical protein
VTDWQKIGLEVVLHFAAIHFLIAFARHSRWILFITLSAIVTFGMLFILITIPPIQSSALVKVTGVFDHIEQESAKSVILRLQNDDRMFEVSDLQYFSVERFRKDVKQGDLILISILARVQNEQKRKVVVFEVSEQAQVFLSFDQVIEVRRRDRTVVIPNILMCSSIMLALSIAAAWTQRNAYEVAAGGFAAALLLIVLNFAMKANGLTSSITSTLLLPFLYPLVLFVEQRFRRFDRADWIIVGMNYLVVMAAAAATLWLGVAQ